MTHDDLLSRLRYDPNNGNFYYRRSNARGVAGEVAGGLDLYGYVKLKIDGRMYRAHRLAWFYVFGVWPKELDHINQVKHDNRISNLREVSRAENRQNVTRKTTPTSGYIGVQLRKDKWAARIGVHGNLLWLGAYDTPQQAHAAYLAAVKKYHPYRPEKLK